MKRRKNIKRCGSVSATVLLLCMLAVSCKDGKGVEKMKREDYLQLQKAYMMGLNEYLCKYADLDAYQEILDKSEYVFPTEENLPFKTGAFGRDNIYIRNNAYVERLDEADLELLKDSMHDGEIIFTEKLLAMIERTMINVLSVRYRNTNTVPDVVYDAGVFQCNMAPGNALVFVISYDFEYDENGNIVSQQIEAHKAAIVEKLQKKMVDEMSEKLTMPVCVFY